MRLMTRGPKAHERDSKRNDGDLTATVGSCCFPEGKVGYETDEQRSWNACTALALKRCLEI
jgi:hypothetical protein